MSRINIYALILIVLWRGLNLTNIIFFLIMTAITAMFKYGYKLQQEVDETI